MKLGQTTELKTAMLEDDWDYVEWPATNPIEMHVMPRGESHQCFDCSCNPVPDEDDGSVILHNSTDKRELYSARYLKKH